MNLCTPKTMVTQNKSTKKIQSPLPGPHPVLIPDSRLSTLDRKFKYSNIYIVFYCDCFVSIREKTERSLTSCDMIIHSYKTYTGRKINLSIGEAKLIVTDDIHITIENEYMYAQGFEIK